MILLFSVAVALHMHDSEMARLSIMNPSLHDLPKSTPCLSPRNIWESASAEAWTEAVRTTTDRSQQMSEARSASRDASSVWSELSRSGPFNTILQLNHICSTIVDSYSMESSLQILQYIQVSLTGYTQRLQSYGPDLLSVRSLWHSADILLSRDINRLELAVGKKGDSEASENFQYASTWAASPDAQRAIVHGAMLLRQLEHLPIYSVSNIHVSSSLYHAAIV